MAVFGNESDSGGDRLTGVAGCDSFTSDLNDASLGPIYSEQSTAKLGSASAHETGETDNFAGADFERDIAQETAAQTLDAQEGFAFSANAVLDGSGDRTPDHVLNEDISREVPQCAGVDCAAIAKHRNAIANGAQFVETMGDVNDRHVAPGEIVHDAKDLACFSVG